MKRFKQYLIEEMATDKAAPEATQTTPKSSINPPVPAMFAPDSVKQLYSKTVSQQQDPNLQPGEDEEVFEEEPYPEGLYPPPLNWPAPTELNPTAPPDQVDWDRVREMIEEYARQIEQLGQLLRAGNIDALINFLRSLGVTIPTGLDARELQYWLQQYFDDRMTEQVESLYPNMTHQQRLTFEQMLRELFRRYLKDAPNWFPTAPRGPDYRPIDINDPETWPGPDVDPNRPFTFPDVPGDFPPNSWEFWEDPNPYIPYDDRYNRPPRNSPRQT